MENVDLEVRVYKCTERKIDSKSIPKIKCGRCERYYEKEEFSHLKVGDLLGIAGMKVEFDFGEKEIGKGLKTGDKICKHCHGSLKKSGALQPDEEQEKIKELN